MISDKDSRERIVCFSYTLYKSEEIIRNYLLDICNIVRLTGVIKMSIGFWYVKKIGGESDKKFKLITDRLSPFLIRKIQNNILFDNIKQGKKKKYEHYFYNLSPEIKKYFKSETMMFDIYGGSNYFYSFVDPTFYLDPTSLLHETYCRRF